MAAYLVTFESPSIRAEFVATTLARLGWTPASSGASATKTFEAEDTLAAEKTALEELVGNGIHVRYWQRGASPDSRLPEVWKGEALRELFAQSR